jgi:hypothetical protein
VEIELFAGDRLETELEHTFRAVVRHVARIPADQILAADDEHIVQGLLREARADCPELLTDAIESLPMMEYSQDIGLYGDGTSIARQVPRYRIVVPFTGDTRILRSRPSQTSLAHPVALDLREHELELFVDGQQPPEQVRASFDAQIDAIERYLSWARVDCDTHNRRLAADLPGLVRARREQVQVFRATEATVGYPLRLRDSTGAVPVPFTRRSAPHLTLSPVRDGRPGRRWVLEDADYQEALRVLDYWRDSLERAPSIADGRGEEEIRDLLVAGLNGVFKGAAASEVFNGKGKTDILIRHEQVNVFIGECKIWTGRGSLVQALDQLFGYAVWRDTKTAMLLFVRQNDVSTVIRTSLETIRAHQNFTADAPATADGRYNFVMHATGDPKQQIAMAFLPFALRPKSPRPGRS